MSVHTGGAAEAQLKNPMLCVPNDIVWRGYYQIFTCRECLKKMPQQLNAKLGKQGNVFTIFYKGSKRHKIHSLFIQRGIFLFVSKLYFICKSSNIILCGVSHFSTKNVFCVVPFYPRSQIEQLRWAADVVVILL